MTNNSASRDPHRLQAQAEQALLQLELGQLESAKVLASEVLASVPLFAPMHLLLGVVAHKQGDNAVAEQHLLRAAQCDPMHANIQFNLGVVLTANNKQVEAIAAYEKAIALKPDYTAAYENLAPLYFETDDLARAIDLLQAAIARKVTSAAIYCSLADLYMSSECYDKSEQCLLQALAIDENFAKAYRGLGDLYNKRERYEQAIAYFNQAIAMIPDYPSAKWGRGMSYFNLGDLPRGWEGYDTEFESKPKRCIVNYVYPKWQGQPLQGKTLLLLPEQGLGDEVLFYTCLPELIMQAKQVITCCDKRLVGILQRSFPAGIFIGADRQAQIELPVVDYMLPLGSIGRYLRKKLADFPQPATQLLADPALQARWRAWLDSLPTGYNLGITWRSFKSSAKGSSLFSELVDWYPLAKLPQVNFINLQARVDPEELTEGSRYLKCTIHQPPGLDLFDDLEGAAGLLTQLDYVVGSNNSMTMFASSLGCPTVILRKREWEMLGTETYPWYERVTNIIPVAGDWPASIQKVADYIQTCRSK